MLRNIDLYNCVLVNYEYILRNHADFSVRTNLCPNVTILVLYPTIALETVPIRYFCGLEGANY